MIYPELQGQLVLVTGGAQGIGEAMVQAFHQQGARVCFCDVEAEAGKRLRTRLGGEVHFSQVDLLSEAQIKRWIHAVTRSQGAIRVLVNNAAIDPRIPLASMSGKDWDKIFATNLRPFFLTARESVPHMEGGASIINFASITIHAGPPDMTAYVASKGGILAFTRSLARELGPKGIRVNTLSPGWVMTKRQLKQYVTPSVKRWIRQSQCIPDLIQPGEIADVALFLASEGSRAMTGQELLVDRGWMHS